MLVPLVDQAIVPPINTCFTSNFIVVLTIGSHFWTNTTNLLKLFGLTITKFKIGRTRSSLVWSIFTLTTWLVDIRIGCLMLIGTNIAKLRKDNLICRCQVIEQHIPTTTINPAVKVLTVFLIIRNVNDKRTLNLIHRHSLKFLIVNQILIFSFTRKIYAKIRPTFTLVPMTQTLVAWTSIVALTPTLENQNFVPFVDGKNLMSSVSWKCKFVNRLLIFQEWIFFILLWVLIYWVSSF